MPRFSRMRTEALEALAQELRFAPPEAIERNLERIEALVTEIDPSTAYPLDWAAFKITAFRRESAGTPVTVPGKDLLADLPSLAERLSAQTRTAETALSARGAIDRAALCARWRVSPKTLERYKREGLVGRRAVGASGKPKLVFMPTMVAGFERRHADLIGRAAGFSRMGTSLEVRLVRRAARYRRRFGCSLNQIALRLSERFGRSHEAVRQLLRRAAREHEGAPEFGNQGAMTAHQRAVALRAVERGVDPATIAARWHRSRRAVARGVLVARSDRLWSLIDSGELRPPEDSDRETEGVETLLASPPVAAGLGAPGHTDLLELIRSGRARAVIVGVEESARARAIAALLRRAARAILDRPRSVPSAATIDLAESSLRWATLLKVELMRSQIPLVIETLDGLLGGPLEQMPGGLTSAALRDLIVTAFSALGDAVDQFEPSKGGRHAPSRLAAPVTLGITRAATRWMRAAPLGPGLVQPHGIARAAGRLLPGVYVPDWALRASRWQAWLWPDRRIRATLDSIDPRTSSLLQRRFGWGGNAPATLGQLARESGTTLARITIAERRAVRTALHAARTGTPPRP